MKQHVREEVLAWMPFLLPMFILSSTVESRNAYETKSGESKLTRNFSFLNYIYNSFEFFSNMVMEILFRSLIIINANRKGNALLTS